MVEADLTLRMRTASVGGARAEGLHGARLAFEAVGEALLAATAVRSGNNIYNNIKRTYQQLKAFVTCL